MLFKEITFSHSNCFIMADLYKVRHFHQILILRSLFIITVLALAINNLSSKISEPVLDLPVFNVLIVCFLSFFTSHLHISCKKALQKPAFITHTRSTACPSQAPPAPPSSLPICLCRASAAQRRGGTWEHISHQMSPFAASPIEQASRQCSMHSEHLTGALFSKTELTDSEWQLRLNGPGPILCQEWHLQFSLDIHADCYTAGVIILLIAKHCLWLIWFLQKH